MASRPAGLTPTISGARPEGLFVARVTLPRGRIVAYFEREAAPGAEVIITNLRAYRRRIERIGDIDF